jgi:tetratricopeptide (TPR) repeat protein
MESEHYHNGNKKMSKKDFTGAIIDFSKAIEEDPKDQYSLYRRAEAKERMNDKKGALDDLNIVLEMNPHNILAYYFRGNLKVKEFNDITGGMVDLSKVIDCNRSFHVSS